MKLKLGHVNSDMIDVKLWITKTIASLLIACAGYAAPVTSWAIEPSVLSEKEFRSLASELSGKVNLFRDTWAMDPSAEFYGGTTRDYLFWLKGKFRGASTRAQAQVVIKELRAVPVIDVREFIIGESDVDVVTSGKGVPVAENYGVRKIDVLSPDVFDPKTELGRNEIHQGFIPAEKIRLGREGFQPTTLGDGLGEIYRGKLSVSFSDPKLFAKTQYAKQGINHPILLALRYLRLQAINYFQTHGPGLPDEKLLLQGMDEQSKSAVRAVIDSTLDGKVLQPFLEKEKFASWLNGSIQKAFRSYTNPTAALHLMREFGVQRLTEVYRKVEPINQYVFLKYRDEKAIEEALRQNRVNPKTFFLDPMKVFPDGYLYHGTRTEPAFRNIIFQGVIASSGGAAGPGLYGVPYRDRSHAEEWGGSKQRLLRFPVSKTARIVDVTQGEGKRIWEATWKIHRRNLDRFAELFGIDIIGYPYRTKKSTLAYVTKNAAPLGRAEGVYRKVFSLSQLIDYAKKEKDAGALIETLSVNSVSTEEASAIWKASIADKKSVIRFIQSEQMPDEVIQFVLKSEKWGYDREVQAAIYDWIDSKNTKVRKVLMEVARPNLVFGRLGSFEQALPLSERMLLDKARGFSDSERLRCLLVLASHNYVSPQATEAAIDIFESLTWGVNVEAWSVLEYLKLTTVSAPQAERLFKIFERDSSVNAHRLAPFLLGHEKFREKVILRLEKQMLTPGATALNVLIEKFPNTPKYEEEAIAEIRRYIRKGETKARGNPLPMFLGLKDGRAKAVDVMIAGFKDADDASKREVAETLLKTQLDRKTALKIADPAVLENDDLFERLAKTVGDSDPGFMTNAIRSYLSNPYGHTGVKPSNSESLFRYVGALSKQGDERLLRILEARFDSLPETNKRTSQLESKAEEMRRIYLILKSRQKTLPSWMQERLLERLETKASPRHVRLEGAARILPLMNLKDPKVSERLQGIFVKGKISAVSDVGAYESFVKGLDRVTPEFLAFLKKNLRNQGDVYSSQTIETIQSVIQRVQSGCAQKYSALRAS